MKWIKPALELAVRAWGFIATWLWAKGQAKRETEKANARAVEQRRVVEDHVNRLYPADRRDELRAWTVRGMEDDTPDER